MTDKLDVDLTSNERKMVWSKNAGRELCKCIVENKYLWDWCPHCIQEWKHNEHWSWNVKSLGCDTQMALLQQTRELLLPLMQNRLEGHHSFWMPAEKAALSKAIDVLDDRTELHEKESEILASAKAGKLTFDQLKNAVTDIAD